MKVAVVANEFFGLGRRVGGFGWAAREATRTLRAAGHDVVLLTAELDERDVGTRPELEGAALVPRRASGLAHLREVRRTRPDVLLTIDYRPDYRRLLYALPRTPLVVWARDPRPPRAQATIATLRLPDRPHVAPGGIAPVSATSLAGVRRAARATGRPMRIASVAPATLAPLIPGALGVDGADVAFLPNPLPPVAPVAKSDRPTVAFVGRLDPIKRPWLLVDLARRFPDVRFLVLGERYVDGDGGWSPPEALPPNVEMLGLLDGAAKLERLGAAWALVNTSIHEALPVTFQEALALGTPIVACHDPEGVVSRLGRDVGRFEGDGRHGLDAFARGLGEILEDGAERERIARDGPRWVAERHTPERFLAAFEGIVGEMA